MSVGYVIETLSGNGPDHQLVELLIYDASRTPDDIKSIMEYAVNKYGHCVGIRDATQAEVEEMLAIGRDLRGL